MQRQEQPHTPARAALLAAERCRRDARQREAAWSRPLWEARFAACVAEEQRRDHALAGRMIAGPGTAASQRAAAEELLTALESDVSWYRWLGVMLQALRERWHVTPAVTSALEAELREHERLVADRLAERQASVRRIAQALQATAAEDGVSRMP